MKFAGSIPAPAPFRRRRICFGSAIRPGYVESRRGLLSATVAAALAILICLMVSGCASPETVAYRTLGVTASIVDGAMNGWGDWVRAGRASASEQEAVRYAYGRYQSAMQVARKAVVAAKTTPDGPAVREISLQAVDASQSSLVNLIGKLAK